MGEEQRTDEGQYVEHIPVIRYVAGCLSMFVIYGYRNLDPVLGRDWVTASHGPPVRVRRRNAIHTFSFSACKGCVGKA